MSLKVLFSSRAPLANRTLLTVVIIAMGTASGAVSVCGQQHAVIVACQPLAGQVRSSATRVILGLPITSAKHRPARTDTTAVGSTVIIPGRLGHDILWEAFNITGKKVGGGRFSLPETGDRAWKPPLSDEVASGLFVLVLRSATADEHAIAPYWKQ